MKGYYYYRRCKQLPAIKINFEKGLVSFVGVANPESLGVCAHFMKTLSVFFQKRPKQIHFHCDLPYMNNIFSLLLCDFFMQARKLVNEHKTTVTVDWLYDDEDTQETGEDYIDIFPFEFTFVNKEEQ